MPRGKLSCWRCGAFEIATDFEEMDDKFKIRYYQCRVCNTTFYDAPDITPYIMRLRKQLREFLGPQTNLTSPVQEGVARRPP